MNSVSDLIMEGNFLKQLGFVPWGHCCNYYIHGFINVHKCFSIETSFEVKEDYDLFF